MKLVRENPRVIIIAAAQDEVDVQTQVLYDAGVIGGLDEIFWVTANKVQDIALQEAGGIGVDYEVMSWNRWDQSQQQWLTGIGRMLEQCRQNGQD